ncbi:MAG: Nif3-like dinuclear metal center hexameric protein [Methanomicrobiales archaeon]|nr:Nif3-like dinuclear metal center hexameric protein [Methanomicrobiales archaeon]
MHRDAFIRAMEELAPPELAEPDDAGRIGLVVEGRREIRRVACALDATPRVVQEACRIPADMLVVHHTPLYYPITRVEGTTASLLRDLLSFGMNLYVMHTNYDRAEGGINDALAAVLGLSGSTRMFLGVVGDCTLTPKKIAGILGCGLRVHGRISRIRRLAVVGGSGFDPLLLDEAKAMSADAFLSAELRHDVARAAPLPCLEASHYALEAPGMRRLAAAQGWTFLDDPPEVTLIP